MPTQIQEGVVVVHYQVPTYDFRERHPGLVESLGIKVWQTVSVPVERLPGDHQYLPNFLEVGIFPNFESLVARFALTERGRAKGRPAPPEGLEEALSAYLALMELPGVQLTMGSSPRGVGTRWKQA